MNRQYWANLAEFYNEQLFQQILPFWIKNGIDSEYGGFFTCFDNSGAKMISADKYVWSQGRFIWLLSKLAELSGDQSNYLEHAKRGVAFLTRHCFLEDGGCAFLLSRDGTPREPEPGRGYQYSIYADCFVVLGFAKYAAVSGDAAVATTALRLYDSIVGRIARRAFLTHPEPTPEGYKCHGIPMILLNVSQELARALAALKHPRRAEIKQRCVSFLHEIMNDFYADDRMMEMVALKERPDSTMLTRYANPGHAIEDMWFVMHQAIEMRDNPMIAKAVRVVARMFELGWDTQYGGLYHFIDKEGGPPRGDVPPAVPSALISKLRDDWDSKLWWVHSEALYTTLLGYRLTGDRSMLANYQKVHDYAFAVFPNPDRAVGEWIQIRDRSGMPLEKVVALPVKDPFHITRNFMLVIELLLEMLQEPGSRARNRLNWN